MKSLDRNPLATAVSAIALAVALGVGGLAADLAFAGAQEAPPVSIARAGRPASPARAA
jgi:hypothetical protein